MDKLELLDLIDVCKVGVTARSQGEGQGLQLSYVNSDYAKQLKRQMLPWLQSAASQQGAESADSESFEDSMKAKVALYNKVFKGDVGAEEQ